MQPLRIDAGELTAEEIIDALREGRRVVVTADLFGSERELTLRHDGQTFYCDTPTRLHKHDDEDGMLACIEKMGYGRTDRGVEPETTESTETTEGTETTEATEATGSVEAAGDAENAGSAEAADDAGPSVTETDEGA